MNRNDTDTHDKPRDDALMARVRDRLDRDSGLSAEEAQRLAQGRREAFERRRRRPSRMPAYGLAVAASVMLVAGLLLSGLFLARGFGIAAWTHALYDVFLTLRGGF